MPTKAIYFDIDEKTKKKFMLKCMLNGTTQRAVLENFVKSYTKGMRKPMRIRVRPYIKKGVRGVKVKGKF